MYHLNENHVFFFHDGGRITLTIKLQLQLIKTLRWFQLSFRVNISFFLFVHFLIIVCAFFEINQNFDTQIRCFFKEHLVLYNYYNEIEKMR